MSGRTWLVSISVALAGGAIAGLGAFALDTVFVVYPPRDLSISLVFTAVPALVFSFAGVLMYARSGFTAGWFFGALTGAATGVCFGIGYSLSYDMLPPGAVSLVATGFAGGIAGAWLGGAAGAFGGPLLKRLCAGRAA